METHDYWSDIPAFSRKINLKASNFRQCCITISSNLWEHDEAGRRRTLFNKKFKFITSGRRRQRIAVAATARQTSQAPIASRFSREKAAGCRRMARLASSYDDLPAGVTTIFPTMYECNVQKYSCSPGWAKVWE